MATVVNDTLLARFSGVATYTAGITSGSFTPANNSLLVLCVTNDSANGAGESVTAVAATTTGLTWTSRIFLASATGGYAAILTAPVTTGASSTIQVTATDVGGTGNSRRMSAKLYQVTGQHASPIGVTGSGTSGTNAITPALFTATASGSGGRAFYCGIDWNQNGLPTSTDTEDAADYAGDVSVLSVYKASDHAAGAGSIAGSLDAAGAGAAVWTWVALEVLAAAGGGGGSILRPAGGIGTGGMQTMSGGMQGGSRIQVPQNFHAFRGRGARPQLRS